MHLITPVTDNYPSLISGRRNESRRLDWLTNSEPLTLESDVLQTALNGLAQVDKNIFKNTRELYCLKLQKHIHVGVYLKVVGK